VKVIVERMKKTDFYHIKATAVINVK